MSEMPTLPTSAELTSDTLSEGEFKAGLVKLLNYLNSPINFTKGDTWFVLNKEGDPPTPAHKHYIALSPVQVKYLITSSQDTEGFSADVLGGPMYVTVYSEYSLDDVNSVETHRHLVNIRYNHRDGLFSALEYHFTTPYVYLPECIGGMCSTVVEHTHIFKQSPWVDSWEKVVIPVKDFVLSIDPSVAPNPTFTTIQHTDTILLLPIKALSFPVPTVEHSYIAFASTPIHPRWFDKNFNVSFYASFLGVVIDDDTQNPIAGTEVKITADVYYTDLQQSSNFKNLSPLAHTQTVVNNIPTEYLFNTEPIEIVVSANNNTIYSGLTFAISRVSIDSLLEKNTSLHILGLSVYFKKHSTNDSSAIPFYNTITVIEIPPY